jgi:hypothetical protein
MIKSIEAGLNVTKKAGGFKTVLVQKGGNVSPVLLKRINTLSYISGSI